MEGPSLVILVEELQPFIGKKVADLIGNTKIDKDKMCNKPIKNILSWGKHLIIEFDTFFIRIHFLMYGSYRINEKKDLPPRLSMVLEDRQEINFYNCSIKIVENTPLDDIYDWQIDIMSKAWNSEKAFLNMKQKPHDYICDVLMDQNIFAGVGNIIKNEVLFNQRLHPDSKVEFLSDKQLKNLVQEARIYSQQFYRWKKQYELKKHWQIFRKKICPRDKTAITREKTGKLQRWSFYCEQCQILYVS